MSIDVSSKEYSLESIRDLLANGIDILTEEDVVISLYMQLPERIKPISDKIEKIILLAKLNKSKFNKIFKDFISDMVFEIKKDNLYKEFYEFVYIVYAELRKNGTAMIATAYLSLISEIHNQLAPKNLSIWGFDYEDNPIYKPEPYSIYDDILDSIQNKRKIQSNVNKLKNYNIDNGSEDKIEVLIRMQRVYSNAIFLLSGILNKNDFDIYPEEQKLSVSFTKPSIREWNKTEIYKNLLKERKYVLPKDGLKCIFVNIPDIKEIYLKERLFLDYIVLIFKITNIDGKESAGLYIPAIDFYVDRYVEMSFNVTETYENFLLEVYSRLTTDVDLSYRKMSSIHITNDINNPSGYYKQQPIMQILKKNVETININKKSKDIVSYKNYEKSEYISISISVAPYIRKLPTGYSASDEAIKLALKYGYKLKEGETFVSPFKKNIKQKK